MADNRNQRGSYRTSNQDWSDNRGRTGNGRYSDDDRNYESSENRGYGNRDFDEGGAGMQSRYEREEYNRGAAYGGGYGSGRYGRPYESDFNAGSYEGDRDYGYGSYFGGGSGSENAGSRNLYERDFEGMGRRDYPISTRNYGSYGNRGRDYGDYYERRRNKDLSEGSNYGDYSGGAPYGSSYTGNFGRQDRSKDEVSSWFGDDEAERRRDRDRQMRGQFRGRGPKNYIRSDERIKEDINDRLSDDPFIDASDIEVTVKDAEVTLSGTVDDRKSKRRAEDIVEDISGVKNVENRLRVSQVSERKEGQPSEYRTPERERQTTSAVPGSEKSTERRNKNYVTG